MEMDELLEQEANHMFDGLGAMEPGTEEYGATVDDLAKLYKLRLEEQKMEAERLEKAEQRRSDAVGRWTKFATDVAGIVLPLLFYGNWMGKGLEFEKTGTFTSKTFMGLINKFRPTR